MSRLRRTREILSERALTCWEDGEMALHANNSTASAQHRIASGLFELARAVCLASEEFLVRRREDN